MSETQAKEIADAAFIKVNYLEMYQLWATKSQVGFFVG